MGKHVGTILALAVVCLWPFCASAQTAAVQADLRTRAMQMRTDWQHYWHDLDRPLEQEQDAANTAGDFAKAKAIGAQRADLRLQYEQLVQKRINDGHAALAKSGISKRYKTHKTQAKAEDAADFAKFLESAADGK